MDILGQSALILAVLAFAFGISVLYRNPGNRLVRGYAALCMVLTVWAFSFFLEKGLGGSNFYLVHLTANLMLAPAGLYFAGLMAKSHQRLLSWVLQISFVYGFILLPLIWSGLGQTPVIQNLAYFSPGFLVIVCLLKIRFPLSRRDWVYLWALFLLATAAMDHLPVLGTTIPSIGNILLCVYLFIVSEVLIYHRLLNLRGLLVRLLSFGAIAILFTATFAVVVLWATATLPLFLLNTFLAVAIFLILYEPVRSLIPRVVNRFLGRRSLLLSQVLEEGLRQLSVAVDTVALAQITLQFLDRLIELDFATFYLLRSDGSKFKRLRGIHDEANQARELLSTHVIVDYFKRATQYGHLPILLEDFIVNEIESTTSISRRKQFQLIQSALHGLGANIAVPILDHDKHSILGVVLLRADQPKVFWGRDWGILTAIYPFFEQVGLALARMDVFVRLREKERLAVLGEMSAGLAHEIRNPLGAIKGAAQLLADSSVASLESGQDRLIDVIVEEVNRLNRVVTQFLDYSKPFGWERSELNVALVLSRTYALFATDSSIKFELIEPEGGLCSLPNLRGSPEQIKQVLVNFLQNSIQSLKQNPPVEGGRIRFGAYLSNDSKAQVSSGRSHSNEIVLFVEDNGSGIARENMDRVFVPFFSTSPQGTGLGLSICSRIIEAHQGRIEVVSEEGCSTRFSAYLPV